MGRLINYNSAISRDPSNLNFPLLDPSIVGNYNSNSNGGGNGGDNMEERIIKLEADVGSIKEIVKDHNNRFDKIDTRFDKIDARFDKIDDKFDKFNDKIDAKLGEINKKFNEFPTKDFMKISISDESKSIKLWMFSIIFFSLSSLIISIIKLFN